MVKQSQPLPHIDYALNECVCDRCCAIWRQKIYRAYGILEDQQSRLSAQDVIDAVEESWERNWETP